MNYIARSWPRRLTLWLNSHMKLEPKTKKPITLVTRLEHKSSQTLLEFLSKRFSYHNPDEWRERIQEGKVKVNGLTPSEGQPLRPGDEVAYTTQSWEEPEVNPNYRVVFEDETVLVISKPAPLPVHAIGAYFQNTLMHLLRRDRPEAQNYHLVHRLDSETSGLLLLAKDKGLVALYQKEWDERVKKSYKAIVFGMFDESPIRLEASIGSKVGSSIRMKLAVNGDGGHPAVTEFKLLEKRGKFSMVEARLLTGRTHQIRVHLEHLGYPIVGDKIYSGNDEVFPYFHENGWDDWVKNRVLLPRQALHAFRLEFTHLKTCDKMVFEDPLPDDLSQFWESAGSRV